MCPATPRDVEAGGYGGDEGLNGYGGVSYPVASYTPPRSFDWKDPEKRPLITFPDAVVQEKRFDTKPDEYYQV